jgi:hypothetical protein
MKRLVVLGMLGMAGVVGACGGGSQGPAGQQGPAGMNGTDGTNGEAGPPGSSAPANPSVSGVTPPQSFLARTVDVSISGYGTSWSSATTVDFGAGVKVNKITVGSPTALVVNITTDKAAATGPRDVTVTDGSNKETFKGAFQVLSPISFAFQGTMAQGSLLLATATVLDTTTPLDTTQVPDPNDPFATIPGDLALTAPAGVSVTPVSVTDFGAVFELFIDVPAAAGMFDLDLVSGPAGATTNVDFPAPNALNLAARTATPLTSGTALMGTTGATYATSLYSFTPASSALSILDFTVSTTSTTATPALIVLPSDGKWADEVASGQVSTGPATFSVLTTATTPYYGITFDNSGATGPFSVEAAAVAPAATAATNAMDGTKATAVVATKVPFVLTGGDLSKGAGIDWVKVTTTTAAANIRVQTVGDPLTDVSVTVYQSDGTTVVGTPADTGTNVDATFTTTTAGVYYVVFAQGANYAAPDTTYEAIIRVQ